MRAFLRTVTVAIASSATTALLFAACTAESATGRTGQAAPRVGPSVVVPTVAAHAAPASPNPAVAVYQQNSASVVNITSLAMVRTRQGQTVQPQGVGSGFILDTAVAS